MKEYKYLPICQGNCYYAPPGKGRLSEVISAKDIEAGDDQGDHYPYPRHIYGIDIKCIE
jgi:hypothetical protein